MWKLGAVVAGSGVGLALAVRNVFSRNSAQASEQDTNAAKQRGPVYPTTTDWSKAREKAKVLAEQAKERSGSPGLLIAIAVDGEMVCSEGFGFADVENAVRCNRETRMRIASISKSVTMLAVARLWEEGKLDLDAPVQRYTSFPKKTVNGEPVTITTRQLVSHVAGIRHYKEDSDVKEEDEKKKDSSESSQSTAKSQEKPSSNKSSRKEKEENTLTYSAGEYARGEYHVKEQFDSVEESLKLFADDDLVHRPGSKYLYSTHGWTLVSAVVEGAAKQDFLTYLTRMLSQLGLRYITPEYQQSLIFGRARYYQRNDSGELVNAPYVNNSYKWAGGGLLSNAEDLVHLGNIMLYSYQASLAKQGSSKYMSSPDVSESETAGPVSMSSFLRPSSVASLWKPHPVTVNKDSGRGYGMGWVVVPGGCYCGGAVPKPAVFSHTGGAIGGSSVLLVQPRPSNTKMADCKKEDSVRGVVVAMICNMESVRLEQTAQEIASVFEAARASSGSR